MELNSDITKWTDAELMDTFDMGPKDQLLNAYAELKRRLENRVQLEARIDKAVEYLIATSDGGDEIEDIDLIAILEGDD